MITSGHRVLRFVPSVRSVRLIGTDRINSSLYKQAKQVRYNSVAATSAQSVTAYSREIDREGR